MFSPIPSHPDWLACTDGHIYNRDGTRIKEYLKEAGERRFRVYCSTHRYHNVPNLIAEAFLGPAPNGSALIHKNGDSADNRLSNLRYVREAGSASNFGRKVKMSTAALRELHSLISIGVAHTKIAKRLGISPRCVRYHKKRCGCRLRSLIQLRLNIDGID